MVSDHPVPGIDVTVDVHDDSDLPAVRRRIEEHALARFRGAIGVADLRSVVHIRRAERAGRSAR